MKEEAETGVNESESGEESGLEDVIVVRGGGGELEISRTPPLDHETCLVGSKIVFSPKTTSSINIWPPFNYSTQRFFSVGLYVAL